MSVVVDELWVSIQHEINNCPVCLAEKSFRPCNAPPSRPVSPMQTGKILFLSEAPPPTGGFWSEDQPDDLRGKLAELLGLQQSENGKKVITSFLVKDYFLLQSLKWPLKKSFNHFGPVQQRKLVEHSTSAHLNNEIQALKPRAILAMGKAAWMSCLLMSTSSSCRFDQRFGCSLNEEQTIILDGHAIPWRAIYLPVDQNFRIPNRAAQVEGHIQSFLVEYTQVRPI